MEKRLTPVLKFLGLLLIVVIVSLGPELVGGDLADFLKGKLGDQYFMVIGGALLASTLLYTPWSEGGSFFNRKSSGKNGEEQKVSNKNLQKIRDGLKESYHERLKQKLASRFPINLELKYSLEGTTTKAPLYDNKTIRSTKIKQELTELFDKHRGRLLIVGEPGAGKTTLLLQFAHQLIVQGEEYIEATGRDDLPIPIIIDIATWRSRFSTIEEWLKELLPQMGFSKALARQMLTEKRVLPFFDGLDELAVKDRPSFLEAVGKYGSSQTTRYVICSRINEYAETIDAPVYCQIMVKPLTLTQIKTGLKEIDSPESRGLLDAIEKDALLREAIKTPFYLNVAQFLFAEGKVWENLSLIGNTEDERKAELVTSYINRTLSRFDEQEDYHIEKWLTFLATRIAQEPLFSFELADVQYDWGKWSRSQIQRIIHAYWLLAGILLGPVLGCLFAAFWVLLGFSNNDIYIVLKIGLFTGTIFGPIIGLMVPHLSPSSKLKSIKTHEIIPWSSKPFLYNLAFWMSLSIFPGLLIGITIGLQNGLLLGVIMGGIIGPIQGFVYLLEKGQSYLVIQTPYKRFLASMKFLNFSILQHFHLRWLLYRKGLLPFRLVRFLNEATKHHILESDGGSYRFRHKILQDYFAAQWREKNTEK